ncbi:DUF4224 domain-containing protein [Saezia sanguinis]|uniref:DUF4224 domain-containing protein n=1 Tax=Saezia sanguinis TaxID=1965230 RepID=UPI00301ED0DE
MSAVILSKTEIEEITRAKQPAKQLKALIERGFYRAYRANDSGPVILERAHYESVCAGNNTQRPKVRPIDKHETTV